MTKGTGVAAIIQQSITATLPEDEWQAVLARTDTAIESIRGKTAAGPLRLPAERDDLNQLDDIAEDWRGRFSRVVLFGVGGSSLGARTLSALAPVGGVELIVPDNLDAGTMADVLGSADDAKTGFLVISKSGGTTETLAQTLAVTNLLNSQNLADRFLFVTEPGPRPLRTLAEQIGAVVVDHDTDVDGRYSVLSKVGLLPALMVGLDVRAMRAGAAQVLDHLFAAGTAAESAAAEGAAFNVAHLEGRAIRQTVLFSYSNRLQPFGLWYRQIWAESLGKGGAGSTPIDALGPLDQHSQLQLYLDGPADKLFSVLTVNEAGSGPVMDANMAHRIDADYLAGKKIGEVVAASGRATADALVARGLPVRQLSLARLDEEGLGALIMQFMLETLLAAELFGLDPFGQPAVEEGKILMRQYLAESSS
jgi:glucose-6-phosphate isomerase